MLSQRSLRLFISFHSFFYILFCSSDSTILSSRSLIHSSAVGILLLSPSLVCLFFSSSQFSSVALLRSPLCEPMDCSTPVFPVDYQLLELTQTHVHRVSDAIQPSHPLSSPSPPAFNLSQHQGLFQWVSSSHQVLELQHQSFHEYSGLISFRIDWFDFPAVQGTLKSLLQHHSSKVSTLWHSAFFTIQFSHPYMTTGKTIALTRWTFVSKVMSIF